MPRRTSTSSIPAVCARRSQRQPARAELRRQGHRDAARRSARGDEGRRGDSAHASSQLAKGEKPNSKRMAQVAAIYSLPLWRRTIADVLHGLRDPEGARRQTAAPDRQTRGRASSMVPSRSSTMRLPRVCVAIQHGHVAGSCARRRATGSDQTVLRAARKAGVEIRASSTSSRARIPVARGVRFSSGGEAVGRKRIGCSRC